MRTLPKQMAILPLAMVMGSAIADEQTFNFNIPAQPLTTAIEAVSKQTGLQPFYADGALAGKQSPGLKGNYSKREAMKKLLAESGLDHTFTGDSTVAVKPKTDQSATTLKAITVHGEMKEDDPYYQNYKVRNSGTATKTDTPIMETPQSIQIVPRSLSENRNEKLFSPNALSSNFDAEPEKLPLFFINNQYKTICYVIMTANNVT